MAFEERIIASRLSDLHTAAAAPARPPLGYERRDRSVMMLTPRALPRPPPQITLLLELSHDAG